MRKSAVRLVPLLLLGLSACSPYVFSNEVNSISTGVDQPSNGFTSGFAALAADRTTTTALRMTGSRSNVAMSGTCLTAKGVPGIPCELFPKGSEPPAEGLPETIDNGRLPFPWSLPSSHASRRG